MSKGEVFFYSLSQEDGEDDGFRISRKILKNEPSAVKLLRPLRNHAAVFLSGQRGEILSICQKMFEQI